MESTETAWDMHDLGHTHSQIIQCFSICPRMFPYTANLLGIAVHELELTFPLCIFCIFDGVQNTCFSRAVFYPGRISSPLNQFWFKFIRVEFNTDKKVIRVEFNTDKSQNPKKGRRAVYWFSCVRATSPTASVASCGNCGVCELWGWGGNGDGSRRAHDYQNLIDFRRESIYP